MNVSGDFGRASGLRSRVDVRIPMRDGVRLSADIYFPKGDGPFPVILVRTPYDNTRLAEKGVVISQNGYVYVAQDCRGRYDSEGEFYPWHQEVADGIDTRRWIAAQKWCDGKIGTVGGSYLGMAQWLGIIEGTDHLGAMMPAVTPIDGWIWGNEYVNGAYQLALNQVWGFSTTNRTAQPVSQYDWRKLFQHLPLEEMDLAATGGRNRFIRDWIGHAAYDGYWKKISIEPRFGQVDVPVFNLAGWFDAYPAAAFRAFTGVRRHARSERIRAAQRILVGPWPHPLSLSPRTGEIDFGPEAVIDTAENLAGQNVPLGLMLRWFDHWLKGLDNGIGSEAPVRIFVMGDNRWRDEWDWPLARTVYTPYYFHGDGTADPEDPRGGRLRPAPPAPGEAWDGYRYDPLDPVWERGGNFSYSAPGIGTAGDLAGPFDQRPIESRPDVLVYTSEPLEADLEATGPLVAHLHVSSSAPDTDFVVRLVDVHPDGRAMNYSEGIIRARYRDSFEKPALLEPGRIYALRIEMQPTSLVFKRGHRIRVDVTSSDFPHFDRNPNTGLPFGRSAEVRSADQRVYRDAAHPSHIVLPVIPR